MHRQPVPPLYEHIKGTLREGILSDHYAPASPLPSEAALGEQFNASRITVRQALTDLQNEGLIFRRHGKGTFVSQPKASQNVTVLQGFAEAMPAQDHTTRNRMLKLRTLPVSIDVVQALQLAPGTAVTELYHVWLLDRVPASLKMTWLPEPLDNSVARADLVTHDVFPVLEQDAEVALGYVTLVIDAVLANHATTTVFGTDAGVALLRVGRLTRNAQDTPIDFGRLYLRDDTFQHRL